MAPAQRDPWQIPARNSERPDWLREQLESFAEHLRSTGPYNQDQMARALEGIAAGREWTVMVWR